MKNYSHTLLLTALLIGTTFVGYAQKQEAPFNTTLLAGDTVPQHQGLSLKERFDMALQSGDTIAQRTFLNLWNKEKGEEIERNIAWANYYINRAYHTHVELQTTPPTNGEEAFVMTDSLGNTTGYIYEVVELDEKLTDSALYCLDQALNINPDRLDVHYGKITILSQAKRWEKMMEAELACIDRSALPKHQWIYPNADPITEEDFSLNGIMSFHGQMVAMINPNNITPADKQQLLKVRTIAERMVKYYPKDIYQLNMIGMTYNLVGDYKTGLSYMQKANKVDRKDVVILANIADCYKALGDKRNARKYLELVKRYGTVDHKTWANEQLADLK